MVRFIIWNSSSDARFREFIYIPIWLDLLYEQLSADAKKKLLFTFQYG